MLYSSGQDGTKFFEHIDNFFCQSVRVYQVVQTEVRVGVPVTRQRSGLCLINRKQLGTS